MLDRDLPTHPLGPFRRARSRRPRSKPAPPSCRGGSTYIPPSGYVMEYSADHPYSNAAGNVLQHRLVMEGYLGRLLEPHEMVHHRNGRRDDNRRENLEIHSRASHRRLHSVQDGVPNKAKLSEDQVREALKGRSTAKAAMLLGVHHQTLRNRFGYLLTKRRSPGAPFPTEFVRRVRELADDSYVGTREAARRLDTTPNTLRACCQMHGIEWVSADRKSVV